MAQSYFTDDMKLVEPTRPLPLWSSESCTAMEEILYKKGYLVMVNVCLDHTGTLKNTWNVCRDDVGFFVEELMKRRIIIEVEPRPGYKADLIFVCNNPVVDVLNWIHRIPKHKGDYV